MKKTHILHHSPSFSDVLGIEAIALPLRKSCEFLRSGKARSIKLNIITTTEIISARCPVMLLKSVLGLDFCKSLKQTVEDNT